MKNFVCWKPDEIYGIVNVDADTVAPAVFWAVDSEAPLVFAEGQAGERSEKSTDDLLDRFLDPNREWARMAVLGPSGAGKSHLIRRLHNRLRGRAGLRVVLVQRMQTNLRAILELLIAEAPVAAREGYLQELAQAGHVLTTPLVQKNALLDSLAQAIQEDQIQTGSGIDPDEEGFLLEYIPHLFRDPYLRTAKWLADGEIVPELIDRQFSDRSGKRIEDELLFLPGNLPLEGINLPDCAAPAREAISYYLYDPETHQPRVLEIINRNLPRAIQRMLNFSGEKLVGLMSEIRRGLAQQNMELVLLFEEFARLQGYDRAMLEALLDEPNPETPEAERPCKLRWALACTKGRFDSLEDTVRRRIDFVVDMDNVTVTQDLPTFAGKYLNASRWGRASLEAQRTEGARPSNYCRECPYERPCHAAFGKSDDGIGLYPFTSGALATMSHRKALDSDGRLIPRLFQQYVLQPVLADEGRDISEGRFPSKSLLDRMGGAHMAASQRQRLRDRSGPDYDRYLSLLELWSGGELANPPPGVAPAFGLDDLAGLDVVSTEPSEPDTAVESDVGPARPATRTRNKDVEQISQWVDGGDLDQSLANDLRALLFDWIDRAIDWDEEMLAPVVFAGATSTGGMRPFARASISFANQTTGGAHVGGKAAVQITLPLSQDPESFAHTAAALEHLIAFRRKKDWGAVGGLAALASVTELVQSCAAEVIRQIRALRLADDAWDPVAGAVELLLTGAALGGGLQNSPSDSELVAALFKPMPAEAGSLDGPLRDIYDLLRQRRPDLIKIVRAHSSASKGGRQGRFVDPQVFLPMARKFRRSKWVLGQKTGSRSTPYRDIDTWYERVRTELRPALITEQDRRRAWLDELDAALGPGGLRKADILEAVTAALDATAQAGLPVSRPPLMSAKDTFAPMHFDAAVAAARTIISADPPETELSAFGKAGRTNAMRASRELVGALSAFLDSAEAEAAALREQQGASGLDVEIAGLEGVIETVIEDLAALETSYDPA